MDYDYGRQANMDICRDSGLNEDEDNAFYAELTRRILLLTDEDDEGHRRSGSTKAAGFHQRPGCARVAVPGNYYSWSEGGTNLVPGWLESLWANGGAGTGVFIPRANIANKSRRRRHNKPRKNTERGRTY